MPKRRSGLMLAGLALFGWAAVSSLAQQAGAPYTILSTEGRRPLAVTMSGGHELVSLDDLAALFQLTVREDALAGGLTVTHRGQTIVLTPGQGLASVGGRLISLPAGPVREGGRWLVPVDFVSRALGPVYEARIELRRTSRLIVIGDLRVPQVAVQQESLGSQIRLTFDVTPATPHTVVQEPTRLIVRFEADAVDVNVPALRPGDLLGGVRPEPPTAIAIELGPRYGAFRASDPAPGRPSGRFTVDLLSHSAAAEVLPATPDAAEPAAPPPLFDLTPQASIRTIVIDPGHGGSDEGARGPGGTLEKDVTLGIARRLRASLEGRLGVRVLLTREGDQSVSPDERAAVANNNKADLFISLHANAAPSASVTGAEVFYLSLQEYGDQGQRAARRDAEVLPVFGGGTRSIEVILWDMAQARYIDQSATFADLVEQRLRERVPMSARALQQAPLRVLVGANMPAVLVEMGFLTNPNQEGQLGSDAFQGSIVQSLVDAVVQFRSHLDRGRRQTGSLTGTSGPEGAEGLRP